MKKVQLRKNQIEIILAQKGQSQNWLAQRSKISRGYLSQIMNGKRYPSGKVRTKILKVLKSSTFEDIFEIVPTENQEIKIQE